MIHTLRPKTLAAGPAMAEAAVNITDNQIEHQQGVQLLILHCAQHARKTMHLPSLYIVHQSV